MLLRTEADGIVAIAQTSHAWISGQLARAWGNDEFGPLDPREEVCLGAEQHDVGMAEWDLAPSFDPRTGLPHAFTEMPLAVHLGLWAAAPRKLLAQSRHAALLTCMHGIALYEMRDLAAMAPDDAEAVRGHLVAQRALRDSLLAALRADPVAGPGADPGRVARNQRLVWTWDFLSLAVCLDWAPTSIGGVPTAGEPVELRLEPVAGGDDRRIAFAPWPFAEREVRVRCEGRRLAERYEDEGSMRAALAGAPWVTLTWTLVPSG